MLIMKLMNYLMLLVLMDIVMKRVKFYSLRCVKQLQLLVIMEIVNANLIIKIRNAQNVVMVINYLLLIMNVVREVNFGMVQDALKKLKTVLNMMIVEYV